MSTKARKERKRAGIPFVKKAKTPTPVEERSFVTAPPSRRQGDAIPEGYNSLSAPRSSGRVKRFIESKGASRR